MAVTAQIRVEQPVYPEPFRVMGESITDNPPYARIWVAKMTGPGFPTEGWHLWNEGALNGVTAFFAIIPTEQDYPPGTHLAIALEFARGTYASGLPVLATGVPGQGGFNGNMLAQGTVAPPGTATGEPGGISTGVMVVGLLAGAAAFALASAKK